jgi:hypothetical protein
MDTTVIAFIAWIVTKTGFAKPEPPRIMLLPRPEFNEIWYGARYGAAEAQKRVPLYRGANEGNETANLQAYYIPATGTIYFPDTWWPRGSRNLSMLLHELVHHVQRFNGVRPSCPAELERQAYELQAAWLREQGIANPYEAIGTDEFTVLTLTACIPPEE